MSLTFDHETDAVTWQVELFDADPWTMKRRRVKVHVWDTMGELHNGQYRQVSGPGIDDSNAE